MLPLRSILTTVLALVLAAPAAVWSAGDTVFAGNQVFTIDLTFPQPAFWDSLTTYYNDGVEQYMAATVTINGAVFDSVGVRLKGNASYSHPNDKKPFRLAFDEYLGDQRWDGLKGVHLNNCWEDPTFLREKLHLDLLRDAGISAPRANFAAVTLNGEPWGFYSLVEHVDKTFLAPHFGDNDGNLYKAVDGLLGGPVSDFRWYGSDPALYVNRYEFKTDESLDPWTDLITVLDNLNNAADVATALPPLVNLNSVYRGVAAVPAGEQHLPGLDRADHRRPERVGRPDRDADARRRVRRHGHRQRPLRLPRVRPRLHIDHHRELEHAQVPLSLTLDTADPAPPAGGAILTAVTGASRIDLEILTNAPRPSSVPSANEDAELVARLRDGDAAAFEVLVRAHYRTAFAIALGVTGRHADAEDVCQGACATPPRRLCATGKRPWACGDF